MNFGLFYDEEEIRQMLDEVRGTPKEKELREMLDLFYKTNKEALKYFFEVVYPKVKEFRKEIREEMKDKDETFVLDNIVIQSMFNMMLKYVYENNINVLDFINLIEDVIKVLKKEYKNNNK